MQMSEILTGVVASAGASRVQSLQRAIAVQAATMFKNLSPDQVKMYADMAKTMNLSNGSRATATPTSSSSMAMNPSTDPAVAADMLNNMSPEQLESMTKAARNSGLMPEGMKLTPDALRVCCLPFHLIVKCSTSSRRHVQPVQLVERAQFVCACTCLAEMAHTPEVWLEIRRDSRSPSFD